MALTQVPTPTPGMTLLSTTSLSGASTTISGISGSYTDLKIIIYGVYNATGPGAFRIAPNASTGITDNFNNNANTAWVCERARYLQLSGNSSDSNPDNTQSINTWVLNLPQYSSTSMYKHFNELIRWLKEQNLSVALITNGTNARLVNDDVWGMFSWVRVSVNLFDEWESKINI